MAFNKIILEGRLGNDPELQTFTNNDGTKNTVANFRLAVNRKFNRNETDWFNVDVWGKMSSVIGEYLHKGSRVMVEGRMESRIVDNTQTGQKMTYWTLKTENINFLDTKEKSNSSDTEDISEDFKGSEDSPW